MKWLLRRFFLVQIRKTIKLFALSQDSCVSEEKIRPLLPRYPLNIQKENKAHTEIEVYKYEINSNEYTKLKTKKVIESGNIHITSCLITITIF